MSINIEQQEIPFDYIEASKTERKQMKATALILRGALVGQDLDPRQPRKYLQDRAEGPQQVEIRFVDDMNLDVLIKSPGVESDDTDTYSFNLDSLAVTYGDKELKDVQEDYPQLVKSHRIIFDAAYEEKSHNR